MGIFILAVLIYGATPDLNEVVEMKRYHSMLECLRAKEFIYSDLAAKFPSEPFEVFCYRSPNERA